MKRGFYGFVFLIVIISPAFSQLGIFQNNKDIGNADEVFGFAEFSDGKYTLEVFTSDLNEPAPDNFYYAYNEMTGSFSIQADPIVFEGRGGVMIRNNDGDSAAHASLLMTPDLNVWPHTRLVDGGGTITDGDPNDATTLTIRMVRAGNSVHYFRVNFDESEDLLQSEVIQFTGDTVLAGLAVGDENGAADFENVSITELPVNVTRIFPSADVQPGASLTGVQVVATARQGVSATAAVSEVVPRGSVLSNVKVTGGSVSTSGNTITWDVGEFSGTATLTYDITLPNRDTVVFPGTFTGTGIPAESFIGGISVVPNKLPEFAKSTTPIVVDKNFPTLFQVESGTPGTVSNGEVGEVDPDAFGFGLDPRTSGITIIDTDGTSSHVITFEVDIPETGTWYLFGLARGDDGNSDSWHFEIDALPSGGQDSRWNISGNKQYGTDWVEQEDPNNDPRPFDLTAGIHTIYLANREDSASIDWLVITNNPDININTFDALAPAVFTRAADDVNLNGTDPRKITVSAIAPSNASLNMVVNEVPPSGWDVSGISATSGDATLQGGQITWNLSGVSGVQELTYTITPPADVIGGAFRGTGTVNGLSFPIGGTLFLAKEVPFKTQLSTGDSNDQAQLFQLQDGDLFVEAEDLPLFADDPADLGFAVMFDPTASAQLFVRGTGNDTSAPPPQRLVLRFEVTEPGDYALISNARTPTTSDDSWWLGVDEAPQGDNNLFRWQGSGVIIDEFVQGWVAVDNIGTGNQQVWNFDAGVHFFEFHPREDGTDVDWFYITNDLGQDPAAFESPNAPVTAVSDFMLY